MRVRDELAQQCPLLPGEPKLDAVIAHSTEKLLVENEVMETPAALGARTADAIFASLVFKH